MWNDTENSIDRGFGKEPEQVECNEKSLWTESHSAYSEDTGYRTWEGQCVV